MIKAVIIDDEKPARVALSKLIEKFVPEIQILGEANSIDSGYELINKIKPELVFLDIEMPGGTGFDILGKFGEINFEVIFTTAYTEYALHAIKVSALDYLTKPIDLEELQQSIQKFRQKRDQNKSEGEVFLLPSNLDPAYNQASKIVLPIPKGLKVIEIHNILYCQADGSYTLFKIKDLNDIVVAKNLKFFDEKLNPFGFIRIHESSLVNVQHIETYLKGRGGQVILSNGDVLDVAARRKDILMKALAG